MSNILAGIGPHSSKHPCIYCQGTIGLWEEDADSRTPHNIKYWHDEWMSSGGRKLQLKHFFNCTHIPLLESNRFDKSDMYLIFPQNSQSIFEKFWLKHKVKDLNHEQFEINLLKCIHDFISAHL